jgi:hypothetical protein
VQFFDAFVVGVFRTDLTNLHDVLPVYRKRVLKAVKIPVLKQGYIKAHMRTCEPVIATNKGKEGIEVPYIVHGCQLCVVSNE